MTRSLVAALALGLVAAAPARDETAVNRLIDSFLAAERAYDPPALARLITPEYVEVSPQGEVDAHDRFLGFYAPANRTETPPLTVSDRAVRVTGDTALAIVKLGYAIPSRAPTEFRATYIARRAGGAWKLAGAQFTAIRP